MKAARVVASQVEKGASGAATGFREPRAAQIKSSYPDRPEVYQNTAINLGGGIVGDLAS